MNASEFNTELKKIMVRALNEGVFAGKMSPAELAGIMHYAQKDADKLIERAAAQQAANQKSIELPPNYGRLS